MSFLPVVSKRVDLPATACFELSHTHLEPRVSLAAGCAGLTYGTLDLLNVA